MQGYTQSRGCFSQGKSISDFDAFYSRGHSPPQPWGACFSQQAPPAGLGARLIQVLFWQQVIHLFNAQGPILSPHVCAYFNPLLLYALTLIHHCSTWATRGMLQRDGLLQLLLQWMRHSLTPTPFCITRFSCSACRTSSSDNPLSASDDKASFFNGCHPPGITGIRKCASYPSAATALKGRSRNKAKLISVGKIKIRGCCHVTCLSKDESSSVMFRSVLILFSCQTNSEIGPHWKC